MLHRTTWKQQHQSNAKCDHTFVCVTHVSMSGCLETCRQRNYVCLTSSHCFTPSKICVQEYDLWETLPWRLQQHGEIWSMCQWCLNIKEAIIGTVCFTLNQAIHNTFWCPVVSTSAVQQESLELESPPWVYSVLSLYVCRLIRSMKDFETPSQLCCLIELSCSKIMSTRQTLMSPLLFGSLFETFRLSTLTIA